MPVEHASSAPAPSATAARSRHGATLETSLEQHAKPSPFDGLKDEALLAAVRQRCSPQIVLGYDQMRNVMFCKVDNYEGIVRCVYTGREIRTDRVPDVDKGDRMNVEHTRPQSQGVKGTPARRDLHHLFPTDTKTNGIRGSYPFGDVVEVQWTDGCSKLGRDKAGRIVFEPPASHKGDVARAMFYIADIYQLRIANDEEAVLRDWHHLDPPDAYEIGRNGRVSEVQGNRNPFVDHPELADRVADF